MTPVRLPGASPDAWLQTCSALRALATRLADHAEDAAALTGRLRAGWRGAAGAAAGAQLQRLHDTVAHLAPPLLAADQVLAEYAAALGRARAALTDLTDDPAGPGMPIGTQATTGFAAILDLAGAAEAEAARRLHDLVPAFRLDDPGGCRPGPIPQSGADPVAVHRWWLGLSESERRSLLACEPARIGALDGVPAAARDTANRLLLGDTPGLDALRARLATDRPARAYLLALDPEGGRAVVATGNPDRADNVLTYVPGTSESVRTLGRLMERADRIVAHATVPSETTAVVVWLGYDAPGDVAAAASTRPAERAEPALTRFAAGLRATHDGPVHHTVLGHSYGSLVVGMTAEDHPLAADDLIFVGSPGVGVDRAAELGMPAGHVWSSTAVGDPITALRAASVVRDPFVFGQTGPPDEQWFGTDPNSDRFGGRVFAADAGDPGRPVDVHSAYFTEGNEGLDNIARIARGDTDAVTTRR